MNAKTDTIPRRICLDRMKPAELAINRACQLVEQLPADPGLTDAVVLLYRAQQLVADYIDSRKSDDEPPQNDSVLFCPDCEKPNQFGELCAACERAQEERDAA